MIRVHTAVSFQVKADWWKWRCSCGATSGRKRWGYPGLAEEAGRAHAHRLNQRQKALA